MVLLGERYEGTVIGAVWMHVARAERKYAFRHVVNMLKRGRPLHHGPPLNRRKVFERFQAMIIADAGQGLRTLLPNWQLESKIAREALEIAGFMA